MNPGRRGLLRWGCAHCAALGGLGGLGVLAASPAQAQASGVGGAGWTPPPRFARPDVASDEGGLWALLDREETRLRRSPFRMREEPLQSYLSGLVARLAGEHAPDMRVYALRTPMFNASMAPNGMMQVWSGLLLRMDNEAQLAAVISHEIGHYLQRHSLERLRDAKARSAFGTFMAMFGVVGLLAQMGALAGAFAFSREHEREADLISITLLQQQGYDPREAARVWAQLQAELAASAAGEESRNTPMFATHPGTEERRAMLETAAGAGGGTLGTAEYQAMLRPYRAGLLEDEVRRKRPEETLVLFGRLLAQDAADPEVLHYRAELRRQRAADGDLDAALADLQAALDGGRALPASHRTLGQIHLAQGQRAAASEAFKTYLERAPQAPDAALLRQTLNELQATP